MGSYMNFKNSGEADGSGGNGNGVPHFNYPLVRQSSVYSLTFDEFQSTLGGSGKDFGSMNMEDLLKSIWTAEESQAVACSAGGGDGGAPAGNLQRQGSLTLPRTLSQKTVDEVWRDVLKEPSSGGGGSGLGLGPREPTLGEMTLEEFLSRAGVVREDNQPSVGPTGTGFYGSLSPLNGNNAGFTIGFQQPSQNSIVLNPPNLGINMSGATTSQPPPRPQLQPLFPKQTTLAFSSPTQIVSNAHISSPVAKGRMGNGLNNGVNVQGGKMVMGGGSSNGVAAAVVAAGGSPRNHMYSDSVGKNDTDSSSASPTPYHVGEGGRGRRSSSSLEKVVERRRRRMIKNRESAARSRARKQAYTLELESEIAKLKEMNQELQKKQEELVEMQKNQILETMNKQWGGKRRCLRRTVTGPW